MLNSHCVTPAAVLVKKFFMILQTTILLFFFFFFFTLLRRKIGNKLSFQKIKFTFPLTFVLVVSDGPSFVRLPVVGLLDSRVGREKYALLPTLPLALFLLASLRGSPPQSERLQTFTFHTIYMGRWYTVVLEEKLRKYGLEFKEVKSTTR